MSGVTTVKILNDSAVVIQDRDGLRDRIVEQDWNTYTFHLGYVDRLTFDEKNRDDIFSTGINVINNIVIKPDSTAMKLSVIIPSKDHSEVLTACMESIRQCFIPSKEKQLEIIIVDNGSCSAEGIKIEDYLRGNFCRYVWRQTPHLLLSGCQASDSV